jgi:hypothetical protein
MISYIVNGKKVDPDGKPLTETKDALTLEVEAVRVASDLVAGADKPKAGAKK